MADLAPEQMADMVRAAYVDGMIDTLEATQWFCATMVSSPSFSAETRDVLALLAERCEATALNFKLGRPASILDSIPVRH